MAKLVVYPQNQPLFGKVSVPSDKSIGHRALLFASLCEGTSIIKRFSYGEDNVSTANAMRAMGVVIDDVDEAGSPRTGQSPERPNSPNNNEGELRVHGKGLFGLKAPTAKLDCGNSGTTMRLLAGILAGQHFASTLIGDASLSRRPMMRVVGPLRSRGAIIDGNPHPTKAHDLLPPLRIGARKEGSFLSGLDYDSPVASAQVKSAILLSGLYSRDATLFTEPELSRDHTERMMYALGVPLRSIGSYLVLDPANWNGVMPAFDIEIPGDPSAAAFLVAAAQIVPGSRVAVSGVGTNPTRTGLFSVLQSMGGGIEIAPQGDQAGEPVGEITSWSSELRSTGGICGDIIARAIDEIPIACALAARASGTTTVRDAAELRVKESDRIATMVSVLRAFGVACKETRDGLDIEGTSAKLLPATIDSRGDHRIAMTAVVLALLGQGPSTITDCGCIATSFPGFVATLRALGARIDVS
ncbi:MAG: 3-phosphoshikimate 1-carboxyvinyltransferase [Polyangiaceae bacterium]|nr:3-phosphoshikimate 1-carboxyvinyltransferase [Polyangiaceae bacterium]